MSARVIPLAAGHCARVVPGHHVLQLLLIASGAADAEMPPAAARDLALELFIGAADAERALQVQPKTAGDAGAAAGPGPCVEINAILATAEQAGALARVNALACGQAPDAARAGGRAVHVSRLAATVAELVLERMALAAALQALLTSHRAVHGIGDLEIQPALHQANTALAACAVAARERVAGVAPRAQCTGRAA